MYYFIIDPNARGGQGEKIWNRAERRLKKQGAAFEPFFAKECGDACDIARRLSRECTEPGTLVTVGGIGTLNETVNGLSLDVPLTLAWLPVDSRNDLTRALRLPHSLKKQLQRATGGQNIRPADYGILSYEAEEPAHRRFLASCGIGLDVSLCKKFLEERPRRGALLGNFRAGRVGAALKGAVRQMMAHPVRGYLLLDGEKKVEFNRIYFIEAHIYPQSGGIRLSARPEEPGGILEICVVHGLSRMILLPVILDYWAGHRRPHNGMRIYRCRELQVHVDEPLPVHADGESCCSQTDISLSCIRRKLRFL